jgi:ubiquinone/menaquinone biosynthesis C-methylase UbiE
MASLYNKYILPKVTHYLCRMGPNMKQREKIVPRAHGRVLEVGVGSGLNFGYYDPSRTEMLYALDPSEEMWTIAKKAFPEIPVETEFIKGYAEAIPLDDHSIDSIVITYTLCSIADLDSTFSEFRRVLRPDGDLIFCEHGVAPDKSVRQWQNRINPLWRRLGGGCNLNRNIPEIITRRGFRLENLDTMYIPGWKPVSFNYWGVARPAL